MLGQAALGVLAVGQPEEFVTAQPVPAEAFVWFVGGPDANVVIEVGEIIEDIEG